MTYRLIQPSCNLYLSPPHPSTLPHSRETKLRKIQPGIDDVEMVTTDDGGCNTAQYQDFGQVIGKIKAETIPPHRPTHHVINVKPVYKLPYGRIYNLLQFKLKKLHANIETNIANSFIQQLSSPAAALMVFTMKKDGQLRLSVDYRALNMGTVEIRYPHPLISELLDQVRESRIFTKLDLWNAYRLIQIKKGE